MCVRLSFSLSVDVSLSLSLTHTLSHTHTHRQTFRQISCLFPALYAHETCMCMCVCVCLCVCVCVCVCVCDSLTHTHTHTHKNRKKNTTMTVNITTFPYNNFQTVPISVEFMVSDLFDKLRPNAKRFDEWKSVCEYINEMERTQRERDTHAEKGVYVCVCV